jgi:hypothetical protein
MFINSERPEHSAFRNGNTTVESERAEPPSVLKANSVAAIGRTRI